MFFILFLIFILLSFADFLHSHFTFRHHPSPFRGLSPGSYTHFILSAQPIAEWLATLSFSTILLSSYRECYGFEWTFFTHRRFLPYATSPTFLTQTAFIKASLGPGSSFEVCRALYWSSKHRLGPSVCLIHSNPQKFYTGRFYLSVRAARTREEFIPREIRTLSTISLTGWEYFVLSAWLHRVWWLVMN